MGSLREPSHPPQDPPQRRQKMVVSKRYTNAKSGKYSSKITKRNESKEAKKYPFTVGPIVLAFFLFVVLGSCKLPRLWGAHPPQKPGWRQLALVLALAYCFPPSVTSLQPEYP